MPGASGFAITPNAALGLIIFYKPYWYPADNAINQYLTPIYIHNYLMGRNTLPEEGNVSMTKSKDWSMMLKEEIIEDDYKELVITASTGRVE